MINIDRHETLTFKHSKNFIPKSCLNKTATINFIEENTRDTINESDKNMSIN